MRKLKSGINHFLLLAVILTGICNSNIANANFNSKRLIESLELKVNTEDFKVIDNFPAYKIIGAWAGKVNDSMITIAVLPSQTKSLQEKIDYSQSLFYLFDEGLQLSIILNDRVCDTKELKPFKNIPSRDLFIQLVDDKNLLYTLKNNYLLADFTMDRGRSKNPDCQKVMDTIKTFAVSTNGIKDGLKTMFVQSTQKGYIPTMTLQSKTFVRNELTGIDIGRPLREFELTLLNSTKKTFSDLDLNVGFVYCDSYIKLAEHLFEKNDIDTIAFFPSPQSGYTARITSLDNSVFTSAVSNKQQLSLENYSTRGRSFAFSRTEKVCNDALVSAYYLLYEHNAPNAETLISNANNQNNINVNEYLISKSGIETPEGYYLVNVVSTRQNAIYTEGDITATIEKSYGIPTKIERTFKVTSRNDSVTLKGAPTYQLAFEYDELLSKEFNTVVKKGFFVGDIPTGCRSISPNRQFSSCTNTITIDSSYPFYTTDSLLVAYQILQRLVGENEIIDTIQDPRSKELYREVNIKLANVLDGSSVSSVVRLFFNAIFENDPTTYARATASLDSMLTEQYGARYNIIKSVSGGISIYPLMAEYYLSRYESKYKSCLSKDAVTKKISAYVEKVRYETLSGLDMGTTGGYTMTSEYKFNPQFSALCNDVCGTFEPQRAIAMTFDKTSRDTFMYMESFMSNYACDSPEVKYFELGLLGIHSRMKRQESSKSLPNMLVSYGY